MPIPNRRQFGQGNDRVGKQDGERGRSAAVLSLASEVTRKRTYGELVRHDAGRIAQAYRALAVRTAAPLLGSAFRDLEGLATCGANAGERVLHLAPAKEPTQDRGRSLAGSCW